MFLLTDMGINFGIGFLRTSAEGPFDHSSLLPGAANRPHWFKLFSPCLPWTTKLDTELVFRNGVSDRVLPVTARLPILEVFFHFLSMTSQTFTHSPHANLKPSRTHTSLRAHACSHTKLAFDKISSLFTWGPSPGVLLATWGTQQSRWDTTARL